MPSRSAPGLFPTNAWPAQLAQADAAQADSQAHRLYLYGRINFIDVLTADAAAATAEEALAQSQAILADDQVTVFRALGGGWKP